jgi:hypothetical protein
MENGSRLLYAFELRCNNGIIKLRCNNGIILLDVNHAILLDKIGLQNEVSGQSEPAATDAPVGRLSTGWAAFFHLTKDDIYHTPFIFTADHCTFFFGLFLIIFSLDLISHIATPFTFLPSLSIVLSSTFILI